MLPPEPDLTNPDEVLVRVEGVSKKFCRSLKKSLWYGVQDIAAELNPFGRKAERLNDENLNFDPVSDQESRFKDESTLRDGEFWAVKDVSFELRRGECLGLIGHNGAGKTTLLKMLNGLIKPDRGTITMRGRVGALIALGAGFNPILTGRENIYVNGSVLGLSKKEIDEKMDEIIDFAEIGKFIDTPVQNYSSGMSVRLGFAIASCLTPEILLVDEVLAVGDYRFKWKCLERIKNLKASGVTIVLVSHNASDLMRTCERGLLMKKGRLVYLGPLAEALHEYEKIQPVLEDGGSQGALIDGPKISEARVHPSDTDGVDVLLKVRSSGEFPRVRIVLALTHSATGQLFAVSSFRDVSWIQLSRGDAEFRIRLRGFTLQAGTCRCEVSLRGERISDIYDLVGSSNDLHITEPEPNYEGFGTNGVIVPRACWGLLSPTGHQNT